MYEHDSLSYKFLPINLVSKNGEIAPHFASLYFARPYAVCSKVFDDNRLYINVVASPVLIDNQDLSMTGFLDGNGKQMLKIKEAK